LLAQTDVIANGGVIRLQLRQQLRCCTLTPDKIGLDCSNRLVDLRNRLFCIRRAAPHNLAGLRQAFANIARAFSRPDLRPDLGNRVHSGFRLQLGNLLFQNLKFGFEAGDNVDVAQECLQLKHWLISLVRIAAVRQTCRIFRFLDLRESRIGVVPFLRDLSQEPIMLGLESVDPCLSPFALLRRIDASRSRPTDDNLKLFDCLVDPASIPLQSPDQTVDWAVVARSCR
jgi:hypothetical protein